MRGLAHMNAVPVMLAVTLAVASLPAAPAAAAEPAGPRLVFDPAEPGADQPPIGRSLFDHLFVAERDGRKVYDVPFPFAALRDRVVRRLGGERGAAAIRQVLIPYSRALPRHAAAPDYLEHPRLVLAVVGDTAAGDGATLLKDRLFIGYQDQAESLEVISYNEMAGRFEFQVVEDYAADRQPQVKYAPRRLCVACHQNGGPIFSAPLWSETNGNPEIGESMRDLAAEVHGVPSYNGAQTIDRPRAIGESVRRANRFPAYHAVWRQGCGLAGGAAPCRAAVLTLAIQSKLSGGRQIDTGGHLYRNRLIPRLRETWPRHWPAGMAVPDPTVADRDPFADGIDVVAAFDPLRLRPPAEVWDGVAERIAGQAVVGLSQFISSDDVRRLDEYLFARGQVGDMPRTGHELPCAVSRRPADDARQRVVFRCERDGAGGITADGFFYVGADRSVRGEVRRLTLGEAVSFEELDFAGAGIAVADGTSRLTVRPTVKRTGRHARLPDGNAIESVDLSWGTVIEEDFGPSDEVPDYPSNGRIVVTVISDFTPVREAVAALATEAEADPAGVMSDRPFRRASLMRALFDRLGLSSGAWCCEDDSGFPPVAVETSLGVSDDMSGDEAAAPILDTFAAYCGTCHARTDRFPANFLHGDQDQRRDRIAGCAERIAFRLAMWDQPQEARAKSPMPPATWLRGAGLTPEDWRDGVDISAMRRYVSGLGAGPDALSRDYASLAVCLPNSQ